MLVWQLDLTSFSLSLYLSLSVHKHFPTIYRGFTEQSSEISVRDGCQSCQGRLVFDTPDVQLDDVASSVRPSQITSDLDLLRH